MELVKSYWVADADHVSLSVPISKVNNATRQVSGWATLDNVDRTDDVVTAEASKKAFANFVGNIREMHQPIAAGHMVDFKEDSFYDTKTEKFYRGIYVTAYVSEGAEDTWKKVLDGTLRGFSIGGKITEVHTEFVPDLGKSIRFVTGYELIELSLVDSPANQLSNIFSVVKSLDGGNMIKGMLAETNLDNVFWCSTDEIVKTSSEDSETCLSCDSVMEQIGWFERGGDEASKVASTVAKFLRQKEEEIAVEKQDTTAHGEGGVEMTEEIKKSAEEEVAPEQEAVEAPAEVTPEEEQTVEVAAEGNEEAAVEGVEEAPVEPDLEKMFDDLKGSVKDSIEKAITSVEGRVAEVTAAFDEKTSEFEKALGELSDELKSMKSNREEVTKRLDALEGASAIKKSLEVETQPVEKTQTGLWSGTILNVD